MLNEPILLSGGFVVVLKLHAALGQIDLHKLIFTCAVDAIERVMEEFNCLA